jgi:hypothetical protein
MKTHRSILILAALWISGCADGDAPNTGAVCPTAWVTAPAVDSSIALPSGGGSVLLHAAASGTQNYLCSAEASDGGVPAYSWTLVAPAATLADCHGATIGTHSAPSGAASPQWSSSDGSSVVGHRVAGFTADSAAIPWLLLAASSHTGTGIMSRVAYVQRVNTAGGKASAPCDAAHAGETSDVPYTADYFFLGN